MSKNRNMIINDGIGGLLLKFSIPAIIGLLVSAAYNVVDTIYIGKGVGEEGLAGVTIVFAFQIVVMAFAQAIGIGASSIISIALGAKNKNKAEGILGNSFSLTLLTTAVFMILGLLFIEPILRLSGASDNILPYAKDYLTIILWGLFFYLFNVVANSIVRAEGNANVAMFTMLIGAILNIILDPFFIFDKIELGFLTIPCLGMGVSGAALATIISQAISTIFLAYYFFSRKSAVVFHFKSLKLEFKYVKEIFTVGIPAFFRQAASAVMIVVLNNSLILYGGDIAVAVFGVIVRLIMFAFMPMFGISQGMQPIAGFNFGAEKYDRVKKALSISVFYSTILSVIAFLLLELFPGAVLSLFSKEDGGELIKVGIPAMRIIVAAFPVVGYQIIGSALFQALGKPVPTLLLSLLRQVLLLIPLVIIMPLVMKFTGLLPPILGIWLAFPLSDFSAAIITYFLLRVEIKDLDRREKALNLKAEAVTA